MTCRTLSSDELVEAFRLIVTHHIPVCDDLFLALDGARVRVSSVLQEIEDATEIMPTPLAELLGLPPGVSFKVGVMVYRAAIAPRAILKRQSVVINPPAPTASNGTKKPPSGRRFDPDTIRMIRQQAADGVTNRELGERYTAWTPLSSARSSGESPTPTWFEFTPKQAAAQPG